MKMIPSNHAANLRRLGTNSSKLSDALLLSKLGQDLRVMYSDTVDGPVPDEMAEILARLGIGSDEADDRG